MKHYKNHKSYYSDFWLDKSLFAPVRVNARGEAIDNKNDLIKLASYKRAIGNFVNIVTGKHIPVKFSNGDQSYTDGTTVVISSKLDDAEFDPAVGLALHEGSHIKLTDFTLLQKYFSSNSSNPTKIQNRINSNPDIEQDIVRAKDSYLKDILNIVEDRRIDSYVYNSAPGYRGYYHTMYDKYFNDSIIDKGLKSDEYTSEDWESYMFRLINITNKNRRMDALKAFPIIWNLLDLNNIGRLKTTEDSMDLAVDIFLTIYDAVTAEKQSGGNGGSSNDDSENTDSGDGSSSGQSPMSGDFDSPQTGDDSMNSSAGGGDSDSGDSDSSDSNSDGDTDSTENSDSDIDSGDGNLDHSPDGGKPTSGGDDKLTPTNKNKLDKAIKKQKDFIRGDISKKKMSKGDSNNVNALEESNIDLKSVSALDGYGRVMKTNCYVVKKLTKQLIESSVFGITTNYEGNISYLQKNINDGISLGMLLGKKLKTRDENRSLVTPRLKSGKISSRMLHEIGFGNFNIFDKIQSNSVKPVTLHISIDASGSMGGSKWNKTQTAVVAIAKAASMTSNINVVISYRSTYESNHDIPLIVIAYDSRVDNFSKIKNLFGHIVPNGTTPEGLCYEAIMNEIMNTKDGSEKYLINFSDGMPQFHNKDINYGGNDAIKHTAAQINKMKMGGVSVLSYYVSSGGGDYNMDVFSEMYGKDARFVNVTEVIDLAKTLNAKFEVGVQ
jgi:cobalamin biosynthesis protein CobT